MSSRSLSNIQTRAEGESSVVFQIKIGSEFLEVFCPILTVLFIFVRYKVGISLQYFIGYYC